MTEPILKLAPFYLCYLHKHRYKVNLIVVMQIVTANLSVLQNEVVHILILLFVSLFALASIKKPNDSNCK